MKKKIIAVISIFAFILLQANLVSGLTTIDTSLNNELNRMLSYNTADDISGEPAAAEPNTYSLLGNPGWEYGYKILEISANRYEIILSNDRMENTAGAGDIELDPPTEESLRDFFTWYEVAPEFKVVDGFTSSYSKSTTLGEYQPYTLVSEDLVMPSGNPRFTPGLISSGIESGAIPLTSDDTNGIYSWKGDAHLPADYTSFFPDVVKNDYKGVLELEPYVYGS